MLRTVHDHDDWNAGARGETPMQRADLALAAAALAWFTLWWFVLPLRSRARELDMDDHAPDGDQPAALR